MIPNAFDYESPRSLSEALSLLGSREDAKILAGGHSLLPAMKLRLASPGLLIDLSRIAGLNYIREVGDRTHIGAMCTHAEVASSGMVQARCPLLAQTAGHIGDVQVRNRGTMGGSLAHADPAADYPAAILALEAEMIATGPKGERVIRAADFFTGLFTTALQPNEILTEIRVPFTAGARVAYKKFAHPASGFAVVGVAAVVKASVGRIESARIGITGVADHAYRATAVEKALAGKSVRDIPSASEHAADGIEALGDHFASSDYRKHIACVYARRALEAALR